MTNQRVRSGKPDLSIAIGNIRLGGLRDGCINRVERWDVPTGSTSRMGSNPSKTLTIIPQDPV
jgi:hypothetical protein